MLRLIEAYSAPCHRALFSHIRAYSEPSAALACAGSTVMDKIYETGFSFRVKYCNTGKI